MCNPTKQPPRRDMYELTTELGTRKVPFFAREQAERDAADTGENTPNNGELLGTSC